MYRVLRIIQNGSFGSRLYVIQRSAEENESGSESDRKRAGYAYRFFCFVHHSERIYFFVDWHLQKFCATVQTQTNRVAECSCTWSHSDTHTATHRYASNHLNLCALFSLQIVYQNRICKPRQRHSESETETDVQGTMRVSFFISLRFSRRVHTFRWLPFRLWLFIWFFFFITFIYYFFFFRFLLSFGRAHHIVLFHIFFFSFLLSCACVCRFWFVVVVVFFFDLQHHTQTERETETFVFCHRIFILAFSNHLHCTFDENNIIGVIQHNYLLRKNTFCVNCARLNYWMQYFQLTTHKNNMILITLFL